MRRILSSCVFGALGLALFLSCSEDEGLRVQVEEGALLELSVRVEEPTTKGMIHTNYLPAGSELGLTVTDMSGGNYNGHNYQNIKYTANDHNGGVKWQGSDPVKMTETPGKIVAYYPYRESVIDPKSIPVDVNEQTDWLYSGSMEGFDQTNVKAEMQMQHAQSAVQVSLRRGTYIGTGELTSVSWSGDCLGSSGKLDATTGQFKSIVKSAITKEGSWTLSPAAETFETFVVPTGVTGNLNVELVVDGTTYQASIPSVSLVRSQVYQCKLVVNASILEVEEVGVVPWTVLNKGAVSYGQVDWKSLPSGVYYVGPLGQFQAEPTSDCSGVALINTALGQRFMVEKYEGQNDPDCILFCKNIWEMWGYYSSNSYAWGEERVVSGTFATTYVGGGSSASKGFLKLDGTGLNINPSTWPSSGGALSDFGGKKNTEKIKNIISNGTNNKTVPMSYLLRGFNDPTILESINRGFTDWYIPSCGQMGLLWLNHEAINKALSAIGGTILFDNTYWCSTEYNDVHGWHFFDDQIWYFTKSSGAGVRLIRDVY